MKRANHLINKIAERENLYAAFWKAKRGKQRRTEVQRYQEQMEKNIDILQSDIQSGNVNVGNYHYFTIYEPKERLICAAPFPERVLHHSLMNVCQPVFERYLMYDSYATRTGKGTYKALERAYQFQKKYRWFLKLDIRKYFDSISHRILMQKLETIFKEPMLLYIFHQIIDSYHINPAGFKTLPGLGLPIGNLTSQYFANHYLSYADWYAKQELKIPAYVRYMDDMVMWHSNKNTLLKAGKQFEEYLQIELDLKLKKNALNKTEKGLPFLSYLVFPDRIWLAKNSRKRFINKLNDYEHKYQNNEWTQYEYQQHLLPLQAFVEKASSYNFRKKVLKGQ